MSTLRATNLKHVSSASNNIVLDSSGGVEMAGVVKMNSGFGSAGVAYGCRAWANFNNYGSTTIRASGNVSSLTDNGIGDVTVNFINPMPDADFCVTFCGVMQAASAFIVYNIFGVVAGSAGKTTSAVRVCTFDATGTSIDVADNNIAVFR